MMKVEKIDPEKLEFYVKRSLKLSMIEISEDKMEGFKRDFEKQIGYIKKIDEIKIDETLQHLQRSDQL